MVIHMVTDERVLSAARSGDRVPETLRALSRHYGLTDTDVERLTGVKRTSVRNKFRGGTPCTASELAVFAALFGVPIDCLYAGKTEVIRWLLDNPDAEDNSPAGSLRISWYGEERTIDLRSEVAEPSGLASEVWALGLARTG